MKIKVEHEIPYEKGKESECLCAGDFWSNEVCKYYTHRNRIHGIRVPMERNLPKCILFDEWLKKDYQKCERCLAAAKEAIKGKESY